jgi:hypothetical protein
MIPLSSLHAWDTRMKLYRMSSCIKAAAKHVFFDRQGVADRVFSYVIEMEGAVPEYYLQHGFDALAQTGISRKLLIGYDFFEGFSGLFFFSGRFVDRVGRSRLSNDCLLCPCTVRQEDKHERHRLYMPIVYNRIALFAEDGKRVDKNRLANAPDDLMIAREKSRPFVFVVSDAFRVMAEEIMKGVAFTEINEMTRF